MIEAKDLRIGNLVLVAELITVVNAICDYPNERYKNVSVIRNEISGEFTFNQIEPIHLTDSLLLKYGFEKVNSEYEFAETFDFRLDALYFDMANNSTKINGKYCLSFIPAYLHQLQNLYYSLTNKELIP